MQTIQNEEPRPLVSFVIPYYDVPIEMLRECIDSILAIELDDNEREIILVDDGSEVSPLNELIDCQDQLVYLRQKNQGLSGARNRGIELCHGQYIQFVDADDLLIKANYDHCMTLLREKHPDVVMFNHTSEEKDVDSPYLFDGPLTGAEYMRRNNLRASAWGYVFKKKLLMQLRFTQGLLHEDEEFTPQLIIRAEELYATDTCAYYYRIRAGSIVHNADKEWLQRRLDDAEYVLFQLDHLAQTLHGAENLALRRRVAQLSMDYLYNIITLTKSEKELDERIERLAKRGLFPLPEADYTAKYRMFRRMVKSKMGRKLMLRTLPLLT